MKHEVRNIHVPGSRILIVGEAPGVHEVRAGEPFVGASGRELTRMLAEAGIDRGQCSIANVVLERPPGNDIGKFFASTKTEARREGVEELCGKYPHPVILEGLSTLYQFISEVRPEIIIALGETALWATTGQTGIGKVRGSYIPARNILQNTSIPATVIPTYHPAAILRMWQWRWIALQDLRRAARPVPPRPDYTFHIRPDLSTVLSHIQEAKSAPLLAVDIETRQRHIACLGFAWSTTDALCIPFMSVEQGHYWSPEEEITIILALRDLLTSTPCVGQNFLYDAQYIARYWGFIPRLEHDTMIEHHALFSGLPKGLDFLSSIYCTYHEYWKDEGKEWDPRLMAEDRLWTYNCKDCVITYEVHRELQRIGKSMGLSDVQQSQMRLWLPTLRTMLRGIRVDTRRKTEVSMSLMSRVAELDARLAYIADGIVEKPKSKTAKPWYNSPTQQAKFFYTTLGLPVVRHKKTGRPTADDAALEKLKKKEPALTGLFSLLALKRSLGVVLNNFVLAPLDYDNRIRCTFSPTGTETYRYASSKDAFGFGTNLQNVTAGDEKLGIPNLRKFLIPDEGYIILDVDLDRADLQVVVWEADDEELKAMLREGVDVHSENAKTLGVSRSLAKMAVHAMNYGVGARTMAQGLGLTVAEAEGHRSRWFAAHPGIREWHRRVESQLMTRRYVENAFGYRRYYFDRIEGLLPEALAWIPQSTVAIVTNKAWVNIETTLPQVDVLLQVHDSLVMQYPKYLHPSILPRIREKMLITIPYEDPLIIPVGAKASDRSWGDCEEVEWE